MNRLLGLEYDPFAHAGELGISVVHRELDGPNGLWVSELNAIFLRPGMRGPHERSVLAHEVAHAVLGHKTSTPENESAADSLAASWLIPEFSESARNECRPDLRYIAQEMNVVQNIVEVSLGIERAKLPG